MTEQVVTKEFKVDFLERVAAIRLWMSSRNENGVTQTHRTILEVDGFEVDVVSKPNSVELRVVDATTGKVLRKVVKQERT